MAVRTEAGEVWGNVLVTTSTHTREPQMRRSSVFRSATGRAFSLVKPSCLTLRRGGGGEGEIRRRSSWVFFSWPSSYLVFRPHAVNVSWAYVARLCMGVRCVCIQSVCGKLLKTAEDARFRNFHGR